MNDPSWEIPTWAETAKVLSFQAGFNTTLVMLGTSLLGCAAGIVGTFALLRKRALMADALAHAALPGLSLAFILAAYWGIPPRNLLILLSGALCSGVIGVLCVQGIVKFGRIKEDAAIGIILSVFFGLGIVLLSYIQTLGTGEEGGLHHFIYGQTAALRIEDVYLILFVTLLVLTGALFFFKEFSLICFDSEFAAVQGWPVSRIDLILMVLVVAVTLIGLPSVGLILVVALLIIPAAAARFWTESLSKMVILSALFGTLSGYFGSAASSLLPRLPAGAIIVVFTSIVFAVSFLLAPRRGIISSLLRLLNLRLRVVEEHLLRSLFENYEAQVAIVDSFGVERFNLSELAVWRGLPFFTKIWLLIRLRQKGLLIYSGNQRAMITPRGLKHAALLTRNHRLWEEYLFNYADIAKSHVDRSADLVEHVLSKELVQELEKALEGKRRLPKFPLPPESVHPISPA